MNELCQLVLFSRYLYTVKVPFLSDINGSGPREKAYILKFYHIAHVF